VIRNDVRVVDMNLTEMVKQEHDRLIVSISCQKSPDIEDFYPEWWTSVYERDRSLDVKNKYKLLVGLITDADDTAIIFAIHVDTRKGSLWNHLWRPWVLHSDIPLADK